MRSAALLLLLGSLYPLESVGAPDDLADAPHTDIRKVLISEFKFEGPQAGPTQPIPSSNPPQELPARARDPNLVRMAPLIVGENSAKLNALHADIVAQQSNAKTASITRKLGIGIRVAPLGPVNFYAVTVCFIPIQVGFSF